MYKIKCGSNIIYDPRLEELKLIDPQLNLELNKVGELTFGILAIHPYFETLQKMKSIVTVYDDDVMIFRGRILNDESGFYNDKDIVCEGELAFLNDTIQRPYTFTGTPAELFTQFINAHNAQATAEHQFKVGNITVTDPNNYIARADSGYTNTWKSINDKLIGILGGYLWVRHEADGNYIDYLTDFNTLNPQPIEFGVNLLDFRKKMKGEEIATAIIPLGAEDEETGIRTTIESVNGGIDYVYSQEAVNEYGWIFKVVEWDDVTVPSNLLTKANAYLANAINLQGSIELDALDLPEQNSFKLGSYIKVKSEQHGIPDENFLISKLNLNLSNPADNKVTLGKVFSTFADEALKTDKKQGEIVEVIHNVTNNIKEYADQKALEAETASKAYADIKKTEAETASKAYADAQIELEQIRADAYADGVLTDAEAYALAQAEAKRDEAKTYAEQKASEAETASKAYTDGQLNNFATTVNGTLDSLQDQIDGSITTWFYGVAPTTSNAPANTWTTTDLKNKHLGDLYYDTVTGYSYRWQVVNNVYSWQRITDTDVTKALADASRAQDTADGKRRVFSSQPVPPYDLNDLWVQGTSGDIMRCSTARSTGVYVASDWVKASKYTDDTRAIQAEANAKAYAQTKATEAQTASEAYALAQAQLAQTNAEAHADGIVTAEEQARIAQATANLNTAKSYAETKATEAQNASKAYTDIAEANAKAYADNLKTAIDADISAVETSVTNLDNEINTTFKDGVIQEAEAKAIEKYLNTVNAEKADLDSRYTKIYGDADLTGTPKTDLASKKTAYNTAHTNLINSINTAITDGKTTPTEKTDVDNKFTAYRTALSNLSTSFETAIRAIEQRKVDKIQIGGRNLILDSNNFPMNGSDNRNTNLTTILQDVNGENYHSVTTLFDGNIYWWGGMKFSEARKVGETYTLSFDVMTTQTSNWGFYFYTDTNRNVSGIPSTNGQWVRYVYTFTQTETKNNSILFGFRDLKAGKEIGWRKFKLEKGNKPTDWTPAPEDDQQYVNDTVNQLSQQLNSAIEQSSTNIRTEIAEQYYLKGQTDQLISSIGTQFEQTKTAFDFQFNKITKNINDIQAGNDAEFNEIKKYIRFVDGDIVLGESTNAVTVKVENNQIGFYVGCVKVSYWLVDETGANPPKFYVTDGEFLNSLRLGNFAFTPRSNGSLDFGRVV